MKTEQELLSMTQEERCKYAPYKIFIPNELLPFKEWNTGEDRHYLYVIKWSTGTYVMYGVYTEQGKTEECSICQPISNASNT